MTQPEKITELTPEQQQLLEKVRDEWIMHGLSTQPANREAAEDGIRLAYTAQGHPLPKYFIWVASPYAGSQALGILPQAISAALEIVEYNTLKEIGKTPKTAPKMPTAVDVEAEHMWWGNSTYGQHSAGYYAYLDAMRRIGIPGLENIQGTMEVAQNAGWWWPAEEFVIITDRPTQLHRDPQNRLHFETGPAIGYRDGWGIYVWHGTRVPRELIEGKWSAQDILREPNAEIRRCAIEHVGWDKFIVDAKLKQVGKSVQDPGNPGYTLTIYDAPGNLYPEPVRVLLCTNATIERDGTRRRFGLTVPATINDPVEAAAWTFSMRREEYARLERAC